MTTTDLNLAINLSAHLRRSFNLHPDDACTRAAAAIEWLESGPVFHRIWGPLLLAIDPGSRFVEHERNLVAARLLRDWFDAQVDAVPVDQFTMFSAMLRMGVPKRIAAQVSTEDTE